MANVVAVEAAPCTAIGLLVRQGKTKRQCKLLRPDGKQAVTSCFCGFINPPRASTCRKGARVAGLRGRAAHPTASHHPAGPTRRVCAREEIVTGILLARLASLPLKRHPLFARRQHLGLVVRGLENRAKHSYIGCVELK